MYVSVNGVTLYYKVSGSGPAVLLVHGNGEEHSIFDETAKLLEKNHTVYALDSRSHGKSSKTDALGYEAMAEDIAGFIGELNLKRPAYCGFSDGAIIGLLAAIRHPYLFSRMVLCGANTYPQGLKGRWLKLFGLLEKISHDPKLLMILREPQITTEELMGISIPTMILAGERDMVRDSHTRYLASHIKNSRLHVLPGENHGSYVVHSRKLYHLMKKFLKD